VLGFSYLRRKVRKSLGKTDSGEVTRRGNAGRINQGDHNDISFFWEMRRKWTKMEGMREVPVDSTSVAGERRFS
jgi:hypothetical protein